MSIVVSILSRTKCLLYSFCTFVCQCCLFGQGWRGVRLTIRHDNPNDQCTLFLIVWSLILVVVTPNDTHCKVTILHCPDRIFTNQIFLHRSSLLYNRAQRLRTSFIIISSLYIQLTGIHNFLSRNIDVQSDNITK